MSESASTTRSPPRALQVLVGRYDRAAFEPQGGGARVRLAVAGGDAWDALLERGGARLARAGGDADALISPGAPSATTKSGAPSPRAIRSLPSASQSSCDSRIPSIT